MNEHKTNRGLLELLESRRLLDAIPVEVQIFDKDSIGLPDEIEIGDEFGRNLISGDFDGDSIDDLVVAKTGELDAINILYGTGDGLSDTGSQFFTSDLIEIRARDIGFGHSFGVGNFDGDRYDDLAIGVPFVTVAGQRNAGLVAILYGAKNGLDQSRVQIIRQNDEEMEDASESNDRFGFALTTGDFDGDRVSDLAIGIPGESMEGGFAAGAVAVLYGQRQHGLRTAGNQFLHQGDLSSIPLAGTLSSHNHFGTSLAAGDFDRNLHDDLAIGIPGMSINGKRSGAVQIVHGIRGKGLDGRDSRLLHQDLDGLPGQSASSDEFGFQLAAGDFDNNAFFDLAIGIPGKTINDKQSAGAIQLIHGDHGGLNLEKSELWHQDLQEIVETAGLGDRFGSVILVADFQIENPGDELAIGVPGENLVHILGHREAFVGLRQLEISQLWRFPNSQTIYAEMVKGERDERFGQALASGDFDGDGRNDLAVGAPQHDETRGRTTALYQPIDFTAPTVRVIRTPGQPTPVVGDEVCFDIDFSEIVYGFELEDVMPFGVAGAMTTEMSSTSDWKQFTSSVAPASVVFAGVAVDEMYHSGKVRAKVAAGIARNELGVANIASNVDAFVEFEIVPAKAGISVTKQFGAIELRVKFNRNVPDFGPEDIRLSGSAQPTRAEVVGNGKEYTVAVHGMSQEGTVTIQLLESAAAPLPFTTTSKEFLFQYRHVTPVISDGHLSDRTVQFDVNFGRTMDTSSFSPADFVVGGTAGATQVSWTNDSYTYSAIVTGMTQEGSVTVTLRAEAVADEEGYLNAASNTATFDLVLPVDVQIHLAKGQSEVATTQSAEFVVEFSEEVTGFGWDALWGDYEMAQVRGRGKTYEVTIWGFERGNIEFGVKPYAVSRLNKSATLAPNTLRFDPESNSWWNPRNALDVNDDGNVSPRDVLSLILEINNRSYSTKLDGRLLAVRPQEVSFLDVNNDGHVTARDALLVLTGIDQQLAFLASVDWTNNDD